MASAGDVAFQDTFKFATSSHPITPTPNTQLALRRASSGSPLGPWRELCVCVRVCVCVCVCAQDSPPFTMSHASASSDADACIVTKVNWSKLKVRSAVTPAPEEADHTSPALPSDARRGLVPPLAA